MSRAARLVLLAALATALALVAPGRRPGEDGRRATVFEASERASAVSPAVALLFRKLDRDRDFILTQGELRRAGRDAPIDADSDGAIDGAEFAASFLRVNSTGLADDGVFIHRDLHHCRALLDNRRMAEALEAARRACVQYPGAAAAWSLLGLVLERSGAHDEAAMALQRAVRIEPDDLPLRIRWALFSIVHAGRTEADRAVAGLRRTVELQLRRSNSPLRREALAGQSEQAIVDLAHLYSDVHADPAEAHRLIDWGLKALGTRSKLSALSSLFPAR